MGSIGSLCGNEEVCDELRKRKIGVCCMQEVRWRGLGFGVLGMDGRRYKNKI